MNQSLPLLLAFCLASVATAAPERPNIIRIMSSGKEHKCWICRSGNQPRLATW